jgi:hypothetical protein
MAQPDPANATLRVGAASVVITPPIGTRMQSGAKDRFGEGVLDDLHAKAIVLDDGRTQLALITADVLGFEAESTAAVRHLVEETTGIPGSQVMLCVSHTHSGPAILWRGIDPCDREVLAIVERQAAGAVRLAAASTQPVEVRMGEAGVPFAINRRLRTPEGIALRPNPTGLVDRRARVLAFYPAGQADGSRAPLAVLIHAVCHPTVLTTPSRLFSGDYPGTTQAVVEQVYAGEAGNAVALFVQGSCGNIRPNITDATGLYFRDGFGPDARRFGRMLGGNIITAVEAATPLAATPLSAARHTVTLPYAALPNAAELQREPRSTDHPRRQEWIDRMRTRLTQEGRLPEAEEAELQAFRLGDLLLIALPGEPFLEMGLAIEQQLCEIEPRSTILVAGYANNLCGYLCTAAATTEGGYEQTQAFAAYGRPAPFAPAVEHILVEGGVALGRTLLGRS